MDQDSNCHLSSSLQSSILEGLSVQDKISDYSCSVDRQVGGSNAKHLFEARDKLRAFVIKIGSLCNSPLRSDVIQHCNKLKIDWNQKLTFEKIEKMTKNRIQKMIKNKRIKKNWSQEDILIFLWVVSKYCDYSGIENIQRNLGKQNWQQIAHLIPGVQPESCMFKWLGLRKSNLSENCWSERQSQQLEKIIKKFGETDWSLIAQKLYYTNNSNIKIYRCPKQCRQHWNCYLNPKIRKGPWSKQEDILLLSNVLKNNGQKRWAEIVKLFNGRTENALKNRYTLIIDKELKTLEEKQDVCQVSELDIIKEYLQRTYVEQFVNIKSQYELTSNNLQNKPKEPQKQRRRASLRRKTSLKQPLQSTKSMKSFIDYSSLMEPIFSPNIGFSKKCQLSNQYTSESTRQLKRVQQKGRKKIRRWNSGTQLQEVEDVHVKIEDEMECEVGIPISQYQYESPCQIFIKKGSQFYEQDVKLQEDYINSQKLLNPFSSELFPEDSNKQEDRIHHNNIFDHRYQLYHDSSINFHSFDQFLNPNDLQQAEQPIPISNQKNETKNQDDNLLGTVAELTFQKL